MSGTGPLDGRVAIITGAAGGIGCASALELARQGASIVASDVDVEAGEATVKRVTELGGRAVFIRADVTSPEELGTLVNEGIAHFGRLDIMFNNAGVAGGGPILEWTEELYRRIVSVNQDGVFFGIQAAGRAMRDAGRGGVIINTGSIFGRLASWGASGYQATKAAVEILTKAAALELAAHGIRVVNVAPGVVDTPMIEDYRRSGMVEWMAQKHMRGALVQPEHVARVVAFLASDAAACINGTTVYADEGYSAFK